MWTVSDLLPPEILHNAIMEMNTSMLPDRTSKLLRKSSKLRFMLMGSTDLGTYLQERYHADVVPKVVVKTLLEGLTPPSVGVAILAL